MVQFPTSSNDHLRCDEWLELLDELNIGAFSVNLHRQIEAMNYTAQALMGLKEKEVVGKDCREIFTGIPCMVQCNLLQKDEQTEEPDVLLLEENEDQQFLTRLATAVYNASGQVVGCLTILQDHAPIRDLIDRIHYEERSLKIVLDNLDIGIFTVNRGGYITFFNTEAEKISGFDRRQVLGKPCAVIFGGETARDLCLLKESMANGTVRDSRSGQLMTKEGEIIPIRGHYMALKNEKGTVVGGLATFHDLTLVHQLSQAIQERYTFHDMIGKSPAMQKIFEMVGVVARTDATILIEGATGTGKDLLAKVIHTASRRSEKPFVKVNCAALPDNLLESEMFGYIKGAFTGAVRNKPGRFNEADTGTIFLDEIGDLPLPLQAKLLRVLEDREFYPLGSNRTQKVDVRIISATNHPLEDLVKKRLFREDLFYRLNVFRIELPELIKRRDDLPLLIHHILRRLCATFDNRRVGISKEAMKILLNYHYPGNVRELENILEHSLIICGEDTILSEHLPDYMHHRPPAAPPSDTPLKKDKSQNFLAEREKILRLLQKNKGSRTQTAKLLGIDRTTLWRKMKRYGISL